MLFCSIWYGHHPCLEIILNEDDFLKVDLCVFVAELNRAGLEPGDTEQVIHHLHRELLDAQELANTGKQRCLELQGN